MQAAAVEGWRGQQLLLGMQGCGPAWVVAGQGASRWLPEVAKPG